MNETTKTIVFLAVAIALSGAAVGTHFVTRPRSTAVENRIGEAFFPELQAEQVKSLEVVARDSVTQELKRFRVENKDGVWRIPSHHNYPAEAAKRLFETATALYGLNRLALAGRWTEEQKRFGTIAPDDPAAEGHDPDDLGKRVILRDSNGTVVADLILGKVVPQEAVADRPDVFDARRDSNKRIYVRVADESASYIANANLDLSTKFADWIEPDLLLLDFPEVNRLVIDNYELKIQDELTNRGAVRQIRKLAKDRHELSREQAFDPWVLQGLDAEKEELNSQNLNKIIGILDEMVIAGVRPKTQLEGKPLLNPDLTVNTDFELFRTDPEAFQRVIFDLQTELMSYGFNVVPGNREGELPAFYSNRGELMAATANGVTYNLYFGDIVQGTDDAIEIGLSANSDSATTPIGEATDGNNESPSSAEEVTDPPVEDPLDPTANKKNRYLMVRVSFDPAFLGKEPVEPQAPVEPTKPEGYVEAAAPPPPAEPPAADAPPIPPPVDDRNPAFIEYDRLMAEYKTALQKHTLEADAYKAELDSYQKRRLEGERQAKRLHERFGPWFYVISARDLESIQIPRSELVRPKTPAIDDVTVPERSPLPERPNLSIE